MYLINCNAFINTLFFTIFRNNISEMNDWVWALPIKNNHLTPTHVQTTWNEKVVHVADSTTVQGFTGLNYVLIKSEALIVLDKISNCTLKWNRIICILLTLLLWNQWCNFQRQRPTTKRTFYRILRKWQVLVTCCKEATVKYWTIYTLEYIVNLSY